MASVFLSYDREDAAKARALALALEKAGCTVWWDLHVRGGAQFSKAIEEALRESDAVVVLWSRHSVDSAWVRDEAAAGRDANKLVPATIDGTTPPLGFRQYQTIDLAARKSRSGSREFGTLLEAVSNLDSTPGSIASHPHQQPTGRKLSSLSLALIAVAVLAALTLYFWQLRPGFSPVPVVAVRPAHEGATSAALAHDLTVKLGSLQTARSQTMRLMSKDDGAQPDLIFETGGNTEQGKPTANLVMMIGKDGAILWSKDFEQPSGKLADLKQQVAFTAARVLGCALEGMAPGQQRLDQESLKLYLNACAQLSETTSADPSAVIPGFKRVLAVAPRFEPAWSKLLLAEAETADFIFTGGIADKPARRMLRRDIEAARQVNPSLAEATLAEIVLLPSGSFGQAIALADRANRDSPANPDVLVIRSIHLRSVGRLREAVDDAKRASELDPLSPSVQNSYVSALTYDGRFDVALRELRRAEQLWPGAATVRDAQYRFHLRYGDPKVALSMPQSESQGGAPRLFLEARADPTKASIDKFFAHTEGAMKRMAEPVGAIGFMAQAYGEFGRIDQLFEMLMSWPKPHDLAAISDIYFRPQLKPVRHDPRFMQVAKRAKLLSYWRSSGKWPDFCFEPDLPYDCKAEAAKLS